MGCGWFNTYYYNQDGSSGSQGSGYIYSTFTKTGKLWWDPGLGGQGVIYSQIDGQGPWPPLPIAACDNASRVIKYVVLYGAKYSSYNLVDMRILDINVVADLTRHDPTAPDPDQPVAHDGTYAGRAEANPQVPFDVNALQSTAASHTIYYWTGPWPIFHVVVNWAPVTGSLIKLHFGFELLPPFVHLYMGDSELQCFVAISSLLGILESQEASVYAAAGLVVNSILYAPWFDVASCAGIAMVILGWIAPGNPLLMAAFYASAVVYTTAIVMAVMQTLLWVQDGTISPLVGCEALIFEGLSWIFPFSLFFSAETLWVVDREYHTYEALCGLASDNALLQANRAAGLSLLSIWLTLVMGVYLMAAGLLIAASYRI